MSFSPNILGQKFGALSVVCRYKDSRASWVCQCDCGKTFITEYSRLLQKSHYSCGCSRYRKGAINAGWKGYKGVSKDFFTRIKHNASKRKLAFEISLEYIGDLLDKQYGMCALTGLPISIGASRDGITTASLDRIDNSKGYIEGNVQWVHKDINQIRSNHTVEYFVQLCKLVAAHN